MKYFAPFLLILSILPASAIPRNAEFTSPGKTFDGPARRRRQPCATTSHRGRLLKAQTASLLRERGIRVRKVIFRFRAGDRYLGGQVWEHYLGFEQYRPSVKPIKLSMIRLGSEKVREEVVIRQGLRYAIVKVTNDTMTAHKGIWSWTAQEVL